MIKKIVLYVVAFFALIFIINRLNAQESKGSSDVGANNTPQQNYFLAAGDYFGVDPDKETAVKEKGIPDEEVPVALFIVDNSRVTTTTARLDDVVALRLSGKKWIDITWDYGLTTDIYYFPVNGDVQVAPFGKAYKKFFSTPRVKWRHMAIDDDDIMNLVNLRFLSRYYEMTPEEIISMREKENKYVVINNEIRMGKDKDWILERAHHEME